MILHPEQRFGDYQSGSCEWSITAPCSGGMEKGTGFPSCCSGKLEILTDADAYRNLAMGWQSGITTVRISRKNAGTGSAHPL